MGKKEEAKTIIKNFHKQKKPAGKLLKHIPRKLRSAVYNLEIERMQTEFVKLQEWVKHKSLRVVVIFEGRDAAGKGGVIKRITRRTNPRTIRIVALSTPTEREGHQWYFQRYVAHLPAKGEMVLFDRSWYNRAGVEKVMGFCTKEEYREFLETCPAFERMLMRSGIILIKYWFSVSDDIQESRFQRRMNDPARRWKLSDMDLAARTKWVDYSIAKDEMFAYTDKKESPWYVVNADDKKSARLNCMTHLLSRISYKDVTKRRKIRLPARQKNKRYKRPPISKLRWIRERY